MNPITKRVQPQGLFSAIAEFLQEALSARRNYAMATYPQTAGDLNLMQLYRLSRGRDGVDPAVAAMLANRPGQK